jgi:hypothetical protein
VNARRVAVEPVHVIARALLVLEGRHDRERVAEAFASFVVTHHCDVATDIGKRSAFGALLRPGLWRAFGRGPASFANNFRAPTILHGSSCTTKARTIE